MKYFILFSYLLTFTKLLPAQSIPVTASLDTGMTIPGMEAYRGKLLILDFWNLGCASCIAAFPQMQALQDEFDGIIQIVLVTTDTEEKVKLFKERSAIMKNVRLPMIMNDSTLFRRFPFVSVPAHVWIGPDGIIRHMTNGQNTTAGSIAAFLEGKDPRLPPKREQKDFDFEMPLMLEGGGRQLDRMLYYSCLSGRMPTDLQQMGVRKNSKGEKIRVRAINSSILQLYQLAYGESASSVYRNDNRVILNVSDTERLHWPDEAAEWDVWKEDNTYSYEIKVEPVLADRLFDLMKADLDRLFGIHSSLELRKVPCWVLVRTDEEDRLKTKGGEWRYLLNDDRDGDTKAEIRNLPIHRFIDLLTDITWRLGPDIPPILDGTGYDKNLDIQLSNKLENLGELRTELQRYGLDLILSVRDIELLVLKDGR